MGAASQVGARVPTIALFRGQQITTNERRLKNAIAVSGLVSVGNNETATEYNNTQMYFRGYRILRASMLDLLQNEGLDRADTVIIGGDSAGGLATWIHTDGIRAMLPTQAHVVGLPDSGFFMDYGTWSNGLRWIYSFMNATAGLNQACVAHYAPVRNITACMFAQYTAPFSQTPMFALQGRFDAYQTSSILHSQDPAQVNPYGEWLTSVLISTLNLQTGGKHAAFIDSCHHHCGYWTNCLGVAIDGRGAKDAVAAWMFNQTTQRLWFQNETFPCSSCCNDGDCANPAATDALHLARP